MIGSYRQEFQQKQSFFKRQGQCKTMEEDDIGEKPFRCLLEEMLECGASDEEICCEFATFIMAVRFILILHKLFDYNHVSFSKYIATGS